MLIAFATGIIAWGAYLIFYAPRSPLFIADVVYPDVIIIHVEKRGRVVRETGISIS